MTATYLLILVAVPLLSAFLFGVVCAEAAKRWLRENLARPARDKRDRDAVA